MPRTIQVADADVFTAIAHPVRRAILDRLAEDDHTVKALAERFDISRPAVSQHLRILLDVGLVVMREEGRLNYYHLQPEKLYEVQRWLRHYDRFWNDKLDALAAFLDATTDPEQDDDAAPTGL